MLKARGCIFEPVDDPDVPWCFFPADVGYTVTDINKQEKNTEIKLTRNDKYR